MLKNRKRHLNIILFFEDSKTCTYRISVKYVKIFSGILLIILLWSIASVFILNKFIQEKQTLVLRLKEALSIVFEYQTRYDNVYEVAYPQEKIPYEITAKTEQETKPENIYKTDPQQPLITVDKSKKETDEFIPNIIGQPLTHQEPLKIGKIKSTSISLQNIQYHLNKKGLSIQLDIMNLNKSGREVGYIWAILSYETNKNIHYLVRPTQVKVNHQGQFLNPRHGSRYNIKNFKHKEFHFFKNEIKNKKLLNIKIEIMNKSGSFLEPILLQIDEKVKNQNQSQ